MPSFPLHTSILLAHGPHELLGQPVSAFLRYPLVSKKGFSVTGLGDLQGCGRALLPGGVWAAELYPEGLVLRGDAGEVQQPGLAGEAGQHRA